MKRVLPALLLALAVAAAGCGGGADDTEILLQVTGPGGSESLTLADLKALPVTEGWGGFVSSTGEITIPERFEGVLLADLAALVGGMGQDMGLVVTADDGYAMTLSYDQAVSGDFIAYDPSTGAETNPSGPLRPIIAYSSDGEPISDDDGPLRLQVVSDERDQVVDGHWTVKWVVSVAVKAMGEEWTLELEGLTGETMDRGTFESGANCHTAEWTDEEGRVWSGIPMWLLAGRLDGGAPHGDDAYDDEAAEAGYSVEVIAADGYSATISSALFHRNDSILVANRMDGEALPEDYFPLRLVGEGLSGGEMVSQVVRIVGHFEGEEGEGAQAAPGAGASLSVTGAVTGEFTLTADTVAELEVVEATLTDPDGDSAEYTGVLLGDLLALAGPDAAATSLQVTASDGYSIPIGLADALACTTCMVAFCDGGGFDLIMPDMEKSAWVDDVVAIEVK